MGRSRKLILTHFSEIYVFNFFIKIKAGHRGFFQFRLCNADGIDNPDNECFKGNALRFRDYKKRTPQLTYKEAKEAGRIVPTTVYDRDGSTFVENQQAYYLQLPDDVTCKHCILQVIIFKLLFFCDNTSFDRSILELL